MSGLQFNVQNLFQEDFFEVGRHFDGLGLCFAGIVIVFSSLLTICLFISVLPKLLDQVDKIFPPAPEPQPSSSTSVSGGDETEKVAAIAYALRQQRGG